MVSKASLNELNISRRTSIQLALAAVLARQAFRTPRSVGAQEATGETWNWGGNAGHTGELPGPGLQLDGALGELWRIPQDEFGFEIAGYANGVVYTWNGDSLWARRFQDGAFLWSKSPAKLALTGTPAASPEASPEATEDPVSFIDYSASSIAIDGDLIVTAMSNGQLWGLEATTGNLRWMVESIKNFDGITVVDHVAYGGSENGVTALALGDQPEVRWQADMGGIVLGVEAGYIFVWVYGDPGEIRALSAEDGSEYWRWTGEDTESLSGFFGMVPEGLLVHRYDEGDGATFLSSLDLTGQVAWTSGPGGDRSWVLGDTITTLSFSSYDNSAQLTARRTATGQSSWEMEADSNRWSAYGYPILCDGKAYTSVYDGYVDRNLLIVVDPVAVDVQGTWDTSYRPWFVTNGVMIAHDRDNDEIVAIGTVSAVLQPGGRAELTADASLRGAPNEGAIERAQLTQGTIVDVTGDAESAGGTDWVPVHEAGTDQSGWLPINVLQGQDGTIRFEAISISELGNLEAYPTFSTGSKAEITEEVSLRGAPSDTSVEKSKLAAGTLVTVTSSPTQTDAGNWYAVVVDETEETGWVPEAVLTIASAP